MPASNEIASNRPLSGKELKRIILSDLDKLLDGDGMFSATIGYGRAAYKLRVEVQIDNPSYPKHVAQTQSKSPAVNNQDEERAHIETPPLKYASEESLLVGAERTRTIDSPNHARLEHQLPITIMQRDANDGILKDREVRYENTEGLPEGKFEDRDVSVEIEDEWGV